MNTISNSPAAYRARRVMSISRFACAGYRADREHATVILRTARYFYSAVHTRTRTRSIAFKFSSGKSEHGRCKNMSIEQWNAK